LWLRYCEDFLLAPVFPQICHDVCSVMLMLLCRYLLRHRTSWRECLWRCSTLSIFCTSSCGTCSQKRWVALRCCWHPIIASQRIRLKNNGNLIISCDSFPLTETVEDIWTPDNAALLKCKLWQLWFLDAQNIIFHCYVVLRSLLRRGTPVFSCFRWRFTPRLRFAPLTVTLCPVQVEEADSVQTLFRGNSLASKILTFCFKVYGASYLHNLVEPLVAWSLSPEIVDLKFDVSRKLLQFKEKQH